MVTHPGRDYFATGGRPFLLQFPPCVARLVSFGSLEDKDCNHKGSEWTATTSTGSGSTVEGSVDSDACAMAGRATASQGTDLATLIKAPAALHSAFDPADVQAWDPDRFEVVGKVQDAPRNRGQVHHMRDTVDGRCVAVKRMPNEWICRSHEEFSRQHPRETEQPWQDIGCTSFLNGIGYPCGCPLLGVYRDGESTSIVSELASEGDVFAWCGAPGSAAPGPVREALVQPLARQALEGVRLLHELCLVHRDLSLENLLATRRGDGGRLQIQVIDFGMASTARSFRNCVRGKASYQAPEVHTVEEYDGFLSDAFALGVTLYAMLVKDYPWLSTRPGGCKCFEYVKRHGFRAYIAKRRLRGGGGTVAEHVSEPALQLLEGLLALDPAARLTLGESVWPAAGARRSVWEEPWLKDDGRCRMTSWDA